MSPTRIKYAVLGAGPAGLAVAHGLLDRGVAPDDLVVIERESVAGGLCRSEQVDGAPLDIGGGHFLDPTRTEVLDLLFRFLPADEWNTHHRIAKVSLHGREIDHPLEANLWQLPQEDQDDYLESIAQSGSVRGQPTPESFVEYIHWKLGERIAREYMLPYNRKIWSMDLNRLGTYWIEKLPNVSFREVQRSCLERKPFGRLPAHGKFLYPKRFGFGEVWRRMGAALGDRLIRDCPVTAIDPATRTINQRWQADTIVTTLPWPLWPRLSQLPQPVAARIAELVHTGIDVDYRPENLPTPAHWIYEPREDIAHHRTLVRHNFVPGARGHWTETNTSRSITTDRIRFRNEYAYPVNTRGKPEAIAEILAWGRANRIFGAGRWGTWEHMNSDVAVAQGLQLATQLTAESTRA